jgi:NAD-dependent SIR2 family protein deacetylase
LVPLRQVKQSKYTVFFTGAGVSTSAGVGDYRGPSGAWTKRKIKELELLGAGRTAEDESELTKLKAEAAREEKKARVKIDMCDAQPTPTHMAMATLIRLGLAHYVVTTNLDGIYRFLPNHVCACRVCCVLCAVCCVRVRVRVRVCVCVCAVECLTSNNKLW